MRKMIRDIATSLMQLDRMHQLNLELLEQLDITCGWLTDNIPQIPNIEKIRSLLAKTDALLTEIYSKNHPTIFHMNPKTDTNFT